MNDKEFLKALLNCASPSGMEDEIRYLLHDVLAPEADRFYADVLGSSYAVIHENAPFKVMMTGHQDEIGFQITHIDEKGFLYVRTVGAPCLPRWAGNDMEIITSKGTHVPAVCVNKSAEPVNPDSYRIDNMYLDIGATSRADAEKLVSLGDYAVTRPNYRELANGRIVSKALDDKIGVYVAAQAFRKIAKRCPENIGVYFVGAVQEELGSRGGRVAAQAIHPNAAFAIDVTNISDFPGESEVTRSEIGLGGGVGIFRNANNTQALLDRMLAAAKEHGIDYQLTPHYQAVSWTDASVLQVVDSGVATALLGIPNRYMHSAVEMIDMHDVETAIDLLTETVLSFRGDETFLPPVTRN